MEYKEDLGDYTITYTGTPEEIAKLKHLVDNELVVLTEEQPIAINPVINISGEMVRAECPFFGVDQEGAIDYICEETGTTSTHYSPESVKKILDAYQKYVLNKKRLK